MCMHERMNLDNRADSNVIRTEDTMNESRILFEADMIDDPYGTAIDLIKVVLEHALSNEGTMNDAEHANLVTIEELVRTRDNS